MPAIAAEISNHIADEFRSAMRETPKRVRQEREAINATLIQATNSLKKSKWVHREYPLQLALTIYPARLPELTQGLLVNGANFPFVNEDHTAEDIALADEVSLFARLSSGDILLFAAHVTNSSCHKNPAYRVV